MKTVEVFDEENSIIVDDEYDTTDFNFLPEEKKFTVESSVKDDYFRNTQTFEYKISADPLEIYVRLLESGSSSTDGRQNDVKDGVVLESAIMETPHYKNAIYKAKEHIEELKKQIEWSKVDIFGHYETNLYILSKHQEIISKEDYRKFLRQSIERVKLGVSNVEEAIKNDTHGLQIITGDYGKSIWYPDSESEKKGSEEYWNLPEEKREESKYGKKLEYVEKFNESLFKKDSPKYVGISDLEFKNSKALVEYIENLLEKKETVSAKKEGTVSQEGKQTNKTISVLIYLLTVFFIILKLTDSVDWNWFAVISPVLIWEGFGFVLGFLKALAK